jgi:hypothetical protein
MRFVVPVPTIYARPNRKFFGPKRGITWLNMINDQAAGLGAKVVSGTPTAACRLHPPRSPLAKHPSEPRVL